jgi:hypothetical protein
LPADSGSPSSTSTSEKLNQPAAAHTQQAMCMHTALCVLLA